MLIYDKSKPPISSSSSSSGHKTRFASTPPPPPSAATATSPTGLENEREKEGEFDTNLVQEFGHLGGHVSLGSHDTSSLEVQKGAAPHYRCPVFSNLRSSEPQAHVHVFSETRKLDLSQY